MSDDNNEMEAAWSLDPELSSEDWRRLMDRRRKQRIRARQNREQAKQ